MRSASCRIAASFPVQCLGTKSDHQYTYSESYGPTTRTIGCAYSRAVLLGLSIVFRAPSFVVTSRARTCLLTRQPSGWIWWTNSRSHFSGAKWKPGSIAQFLLQNPLSPLRRIGADTKSPCCYLFVRLFPQFESIAILQITQEVYRWVFQSTRLVFAMSDMEDQGVDYMLEAALKGTDKTDSSRSATSARNQRTQVSTSLLNEDLKIFVISLRRPILFQVPFFGFIV